jgi:type IV secretory pathway TraG/TraD family ATPase VirD4
VAAVPIASQTRIKKEEEEDTALSRQPYITSLATGSSERTEKRRRLFTAHEILLLKQGSYFVNLV